MRGVLCPEPGVPGMLRCVPLGEALRTGSSAPRSLCAATWAPLMPLTGDALFDAMIVLCRLQLQAEAGFCTCGRMEYTAGVTIEVLCVFLGRKDKADP